MLYVFGPYVLDYSARRLSCHGQRVDIQSKTIDVLQFLIERAGTVVSRGEIHQALWPSDVVDDNNVTQHIFMARQAFAKYTYGETYITTVAGKGYAFAAPVARQDKLPVTRTDAAWQMCLRGRFFADQRTAEALRTASTCFADAVVLDPALSDAFLGLATSNLLCAEYLFGEPAQHFQNARIAARRTLELDPANGDAFAVLGDVAFMHDWDTAAAREALDKATALAPSSLGARINKAWFLAATGDHPGAMSEIESALRQDPFSLKLLTMLGALAFYARGFDAAESHCRNVLAMDDGYDLAAYYLSNALLALGRFPEARRISEERARGSYGQQFITTFAFSAAMSGDNATALEQIGRLLNRSEMPFASSFNIAMVHVALEEYESAIDVLRGGIAARDPWLVFLGSHPLYDGLRGRADFEAIVDQVLRLR